MFTIFLLVVPINEKYAKAGTKLSSQETQRTSGFVIKKALYVFHVFQYDDHLLLFCILSCVSSQFSASPASSSLAHLHPPCSSSQSSASPASSSPASFAFIHVCLVNLPPVLHHPDLHHYLLVILHPRIRV